MAGKDGPGARGETGSGRTGHNVAPAWYRDGRPHVWLPYTQMQTAPQLPAVTRAEGVTLTLADGRTLIDGIGSWWTACHGYNHPHIVAAVEAQNRAMQHVMFAGLAHEPAYRLASRLAALLPGDLNHVFFSDSGSVAVEIALKMALQYWTNRGVRDRTRFLSFRGGYHGDTMAAMAVTDPDNAFHAAFRGFLPEPIIADIPKTGTDLASLDALIAANRDSLAAIIIEPLVQAAGGMKIYAPEILAGIRESARRHGVLFIADEIFTGFGRAGTLFACEAAEIVPDIMCLGKAIAGGAMSLAATVATDEIYNAFLSDDPSKALMHGPTFMANPLACAAANASLELFETEPRLAEIAAIEAALAEGLEPCRALPGVKDIRIKGAIGAVQMDGAVNTVALSERFRDEGVFVRPFGDVIYLTPAFIIREAELAALTGAIRRTIGSH
jgi:adenosylmethionine---8-amino-7-oxononanoate aminotransferase